MNPALMMPALTCRTCGSVNPIAYFAPVSGTPTGSCLCIPCAKARGWLDRDDNLKPGITL